MGPPDGGGDLIDHQGCGHALHNPTQGGGGALQGPLLDGGEGRHSVTEALGGHALKSVPLVVKGDALDGEGRGHGAEGVPEEGGPALHSSLPVQGGGEDGVRYTAFYEGSLGSTREIEPPAGICKSVMTKNKESVMGRGIAQSTVGMWVITKPTMRSFRVQIRNLAMDHPKEVRF